MAESYREAIIIPLELYQKLNKADQPTTIHPAINKTEQATAGLPVSTKVRLHDHEQLSKVHPIPDPKKNR